MVWGLANAGPHPTVCLDRGKLDRSDRVQNVGKEKGRNGI